MVSVPRVPEMCLESAYGSRQAEQIPGSRGRRRSSGRAMARMENCRCDDPERHIGHERVADARLGETQNITFVRRWSAFRQKE